MGTRKDTVTETLIKNDLIAAMKEKDAVKMSCLRMLIAAIANYKIEKRIKEDISSEDLFGIISKQVASRKDSIEQFTKGGREDLADKEKKETEILKSYLPPALSEGELTDIIKKTIEETGACTRKDMGKVMGKVIAAVKGRADGKLINKIVSALLPNPHA